VFALQFALMLPINASYFWTVTLCEQRSYGTKPFKQVSRLDGELLLIVKKNFFGLTNLFVVFLPNNAFGLTTHSFGIALNLTLFQLCTEPLNMLCLYCFF